MENNLDTIDERSNLNRSYMEAGVDIHSGYRAVELMNSHIKRTHTAGVFSDLGGFSGMYMPDLSGMKEPVLVSGTDGVGTKLKLAFATGRHDTVGIDAVAMSVNDIICCGAKPLFFLDYIATGRIEPEVVASIVKGVADGCVMAGAALIGGETAEMPGFYADNEYDLAGFAVGIVDRKNIISKDYVSPGDAIIGLASSGFHSNGFSLIRKVFDIENIAADAYIDRLGVGLLDALLTPTTIYVKPIMALLETHISVSGISHITGGGFFENIPRCLKEGLSARIDRGSIETPEVIKLLMEIASIPERDMFNTFNMGIGMVVVVDCEQAEDAVTILNSEGAKAYIIGEVVESNQGVILW